MTRHMRGYSRFKKISVAKISCGMAADLVQYVPVKGSTKISFLVLINRSSRAQRVSVLAYVEWVLGSSNWASFSFVSTEIDALTGAMFARTPGLGVWFTYRLRRYARDAKQIGPIASPLRFSFGGIF
jgi:cyclic beta-1,2-glucan synthetase